MATATANPRQIPVQTVQDPYDGMIVVPGTVPPPGWQLVHMDNGTLELHPQGKRNFKVLAKHDMLKEIDKAHERCLPTEENPDRRPVKLLMNPKCRQMFPYVRSWGDYEAEVDVCTDGRKLNQEEPAFKFLTNEQA